MRNANRKSQRSFQGRKSIVFARSTLISNMSMQPSRSSAWSDREVRKVKISIFVFAGSVCCLLCQCAGHDQKVAKRYIVESERQWAASVATGDSSTVERILADDF